MSSFRFLLVPALVAGTFAASAQDLQEAYNLSNLTVQGTARSMGFGNALGSVGADFGTTSVNPAGLGLYRSSELTFTPSLRMNSASSQYLGTTTLDNNVHFNINNFGMVFTSAPKGKRYERRAWKVVSFALGMNRVADFNRNYTFTGKNTTSSATQGFEADANQFPNLVHTSDDLFNFPYQSYLGYNAYVIDSTGRGYASIVPFAGGIMQTKAVKQTGHVDDYTFSLGGNYKEKFMLGATIGIPSVKYHLQTTYSETLAQGNNAPNPYGFSSFTYSQTRDITGGGVNVKIGGIYKISDNIRVGAAFHSPTLYALTDVYTPYLSAYMGNPAYTGNTPEYAVPQLHEVSLDNGAIYQPQQLSYSFITPARAILSGTYILKGKGFITADYEYIGYGGMRYLLPTSDGTADYQTEESNLNQALKNAYKGTSNIRVGAEGLITKFFMARAGFGYYGNPYKTSGIDGSRIDISGGLGFRTENFFVDLALVHSMYQSQFGAYTMGASSPINYAYVVSGPAVVTPTATTSFNINNLALTVGCKF